VVCYLQAFHPKCCMLFESLMCSIWSAHLILVGSIILLKLVKQQMNANSHSIRWAYKPTTTATTVWWSVQIMKLLIMQFSAASCHFIPLRSKYSPKHPVLKHNQCVLPFTWETKVCPIQNFTLNYCDLLFGLYPSSLCFATTTFQGMVLPSSSGETYSVGSGRSS
jgi:hypothetical protein